MMHMGFLPGLPALIQNKAQYGFYPDLEKKYADWPVLLANANNNPKITKPFPDGLEMVFDWQDKIILIAEDEEANFLYLKAALIKTKATVIRAKNGREAVDIVRTHPDINLVLMDIKMPVMNGIDATKMIRSLNSSVVVIAQTAYANEDDRHIYLNSGCNDFLSKPITREKLLKTISQYL